MSLIHLKATRSDPQARAKPTTSTTAIDAVLEFVGKSARGGESVTPQVYRGIPP